MSSGKFRQPWCLWWMDVEKENSGHMMGKGIVPGQKRAALADLPNKVANTKWMDLEKENSVHMMGKGIVPGQKRAALADVPNKVANTKVPGVPWVADEVWERMTRHCNRHLKPMANKVSRRGEKPVTYVDTLQRQRDSRSKDNAERLMQDRKVWRASILESRRTVPTKTTVEDIDAGDSEMPHLCSEYVKDIYAYLMVLEVKQAVRPGYLKAYKITAHMRAVLIDWLIQVHSRFQMLQETLYLTVAILDRFLQVQPVSPNMLQLVGVAALLLASKYEEAQIDAAGIRELADITDNNYTTTQIRQMERMVLRRLNFELGRPLALHFLRRASKAANGTVEIHMLAKYFMELTLLDYDMVHYRPSEIAAASLCLSQLLLDGLPWTSTEQHYTTYDEVHLKPIMQHIAKNVINESITTFQAVKEKYSGSKLMNVTRLSELQLSAVKSLAAPLLGKNCG